MAVTLCSFSIASAMPSPQKDDYEYNLVVYPSKGGTGSKVKISKNYFKAKAHEKKGYRFTHWVIKGKYTFKFGNPKSKTIKLFLHSDCEAIPYFKSINKKIHNSTPVIINKSPTSPKTGDIGDNKLQTLSIMFIITSTVLLFVIFFAIFFSLNLKRRSKMNNEK